MRNREEEKEEKNDVPDVKERRFVLAVESHFHARYARWDFNTVPIMWPGAEFDRYELQIYEEVVRMPPFQRKTLVLIGAQGVGRRSLKNRLIVLNPLRFGTTVPCEKQCLAAAAMQSGPSRPRLNTLSSRHPQSRRGSPETTTATARTTASPRGRTWRKTSGRAATWSTESTTETSTEPRSTPSTRWWRRAAPASWMSTLRLGRGHDLLVCHNFEMASYWPFKSQASYRSV